MRFVCLAILVCAARSLWADGNAEQLKGLELQRASLVRQRASVRQQAGLKDDSSASETFVLLPALPPLAQADCAALDPDERENLIAAAAKKHSVPARLIRAVMRQESAFRPCAVSVKGAQGLMQLMPATAFELHVADPFDPVQNVFAGTAYLKRLIDRYRGNLSLALAAYNAGANRVEQATPAEYPLETQDYLTNIFAELDAPEEK